MLVMLASVLSKLEVVFILARIKQVIYLNLFIVTFGGPYRVKSSNGSSYFLTIMNDANRSVWVYLMHKKGEVGNLLKGFVAMAKW